MPPNAERIRFADGPVFYTRTVVSELAITVNSRSLQQGGRGRVANDGTRNRRSRVPRGPGQRPRLGGFPGEPRDRPRRDRDDRGMREAFDVVRCNVTGGYEVAPGRARADQLRAGSLEVTLVASPVAAVVYHALRATLDGRPITTDVLVPIPSAYPGQFLDYAYLPEGSPLIGRVPGARRPAHPRPEQGLATRSAITRTTAVGRPLVEPRPPRFPHLLRGVAVMAEDRVIAPPDRPRSGRPELHSQGPGGRTASRSSAGVFSRYPRSRVGHLHPLRLPTHELGPRDEPRGGGNTPGAGDMDRQSPLAVFRDAYSRRAFHEATGPLAVGVAHSHPEGYQTSRVSSMTTWMGISPELAAYGGGKPCGGLIVRRTSRASHSPARLRPGPVAARRRPVHDRRSADQSPCI